MISSTMQVQHLDNSPLYSAIIEIRFTTTIPEDAVPGVLYSKLQEGNPDIQISALPASQLPQALRQQDPNLRYAPIQRLTMPTGVIINIGSTVLSLETNSLQQNRSYPGWDSFFRQFKDILQKVDFITRIERIGVRYINIFREEDFTDKLNVKLHTGWESQGLIDNSTSTIFFVEKNSLKAKTTIASDATVQDESGTTIQGQLIDIDTFIEGEIPPEDIETRVNQAHNLTKEIFFSIPSADLLSKLGPRSE